MNEAPTNRKRLGSVAAAEHIGVTTRELKEMRRARKLPYYRLGHRTVSYAIADLDAFLDGCRVEAIPEKSGAWHGAGQKTEDYRPQGNRTDRANGTHGKGGGL